MTAYDFTLILDVPDADESFLDTFEGPLFEAFDGDVTPGVSEGRARLRCTLVGRSLPEAVRRALTRLEALGLSVLRVEASPAAYRAREAA